MSKTAAILAIPGDEIKYRALHDKIRQAYIREYFLPDGRLSAATQTAHAVSLYFGLVPDIYKSRVMAELVALIESNDGHLTTGFIGTPYICHALSQDGRTDLAYKLLLNEDYPSWLYPLSKGATTIWEHWDGIKPDNTRWDDEMNSFNHYAYGAVADFLYSTVGGIDTREGGPGYKHSIIAPKPGGDITSAEVSKKTPYGTLSADWKLDNGYFAIDITIPPNTCADVVLPFFSDVAAADLKDCLADRYSDDGILRLGSGDYRLRYKM